MEPFFGEFALSDCFEFSEARGADDCAAFDIDNDPPAKIMSKHAAEEPVTEACDGSNMIVDASVDVF